MNVWIKRVLIALPVLLVGGFILLLVYLNVIRDDAPAELGTADLAEAVTGSSAAPDAAPVTSAPGTASGGTPTTADAPTTAPATTAVASGFDGAWDVTEESQLGYRVDEVLFGVNATAAGRTNEIDGALMISGSTVEEASFTVDVASITSDDDRRDGQFRGQIMDTTEFPDATFTLTAPIELGTLPADGQQLTAQATGELTLHGVTNPVRFDVTAQAEPGRIGVLGSIPVVFADYGIDSPSRPGITTEDDGLVEFVLVFAPAA